MGVLWAQLYHCLPCGIINALLAMYSFFSDMTVAQLCPNQCDTDKMLQMQALPTLDHDCSQGTVNCPEDATPT